VSPDVTIHRQNPVIVKAVVLWSSASELFVTDLLCFWVQPAACLLKPSVLCFNRVWPVFVHHHTALLVSRVNNTYYHPWFFPVILYLDKTNNDWHSDDSVQAKGCLVQLPLALHLGLSLVSRFTTPGKSYQTYLAYWKYFFVTFVRYLQQIVFSSRGIR
jgi:hypothetical protein